MSVAPTRCFIIAEAGSNHNGSLEMAKRLIDIAVTAGADAVKFQIFKAATLYPKVEINVRYLNDLGVQEGLYDLIKKYEVPDEWVPILSEYCRKSGVEFMATPFDLEAVKLLDPYVDRFKIANYESFYGDLVREVIATGKPLVISVGACTGAEVDALMERVVDDARERTTLLQCVAKYPAPVEALNLLTLPAMRERYGVDVGLSDHTDDAIVGPVAAVALGATVIEKHYTLSKQLPGPDHAFALEPHELTAMVKAIRATEKARGSAERAIHPVERELRHYKRAYYLTRDVGKGKAIAPEDLVVLRNTGRDLPTIAPLEPKDVVGRKLAHDKRSGEMLVEGDLA